MDVEIDRGANLNDLMSGDSENSSFNEKFGKTPGNPKNRATKYKPPDFLFDG